MRITAIDAHILSTQKVDGTKKYEDAAGLKFPQDTASKEVAGRTDQRHLCVYPTDRSTVLVKIEAENGLIGIGEAHAPVAPKVVHTIIKDLFSPHY